MTRAHFPKRLIPGACVSASILLATPIIAETIHVDDDGVQFPDAQYNSIQAAIDAAQNGDTVLVAAGIYRGNPNDADGWVVNLGSKQLTIRGEGDTTVIYAADEKNETIGGGLLCGNGQGRETVIEGIKFQGYQISTEIAYEGVGLKTEDTSPTIRDCTFTLCSVGIFNKAGVTDPNNRSSPRISSCQFLENGDASKPGLCFYDDGGMANKNSDPVIEDCTFEGNRAQNGGAIANTNSSPSITGCTFLRNEGHHSGGAIYNGPTFDGGGLSGCNRVPNTSSNPVITNCLFTENEASRGGAMAGNFANPTVENCVFQTNRTSSLGQNDNENGGAVYSRDGSPTFTGCTFEENYATEEGGAVYTSNSTPTFESCIIRENGINRDPDHFPENEFTGNGGGLLIENGAALIHDCVIESNSAWEGGGLFTRGDASLIQLSHIAKNTAFSIGGGARTQSNDLGSGPVFDRCFFWSNKCPNNTLGGGIFIDAVASVNLTGRPVVYGCSFFCNEANEGGGAYVANDGGHDIDSTFERCLFFGNHASDGEDGECPPSSNGTCAYGGGAAIFSASENAFLQCLFLENTSDGDGGGLSVRRDMALPHVVCDSRFDGNKADYDGDGDPNTFYGDSINTEFCFATFENNCSCIGQDFVAPAGCVDFEGVPTCLSLTRSCPADLNFDGRVDGPDLSMLLGYWGDMVTYDCSELFDLDASVPHAAPTYHSSPACSSRYEPCLEGLALDCEGNCVPQELVDPNCGDQDDGCLQLNPEWLDAAIRNTNPAKRADINSDGIVDGADLSSLLGAWGACSSSP